MTNESIRAIRDWAKARCDLFLVDVCDAALQTPDADGNVEGPAGGSCSHARLVALIEDMRYGDMTTGEAAGRIVGMESGKAHEGAS